jgi:steroid delta-isomerase-like uncharacterized protein
MSNKQLARRWFEEVWNQRDATAIPRMLSADCVVHGLGEQGEDLIGPDGFRPFWQKFTSAFNDLQIVIEDLIEEDDRVVVRWRTTGTLTGDALGVKATSKKMTTTGMTIMRVLNGKLVEG